MAGEYWENLPDDQKMVFQLQEINRLQAENRAIRAEEKLARVLERLKQDGADTNSLLYGRDLDREIRTLKARITVLEQENKYLRNANAALISGKTPEEIIIEAEVPDKKIKSPGRPGVETWEATQMKKKRKDGWTIREIAECHGRSVGVVQRIVADVDIGPDAVAKHRNERNQSLTKSRKTARVARKNDKK